jgi:hypothetical protein
MCLFAGIQDWLGDFHWTTDNLTHYLMCSYKIILSHQFSFVGTQDSSQKQMGGVCFPNYYCTYKPLSLWCAPFERHISSQLAPSLNSSGKLTNSDLKLVSELVHHKVFAQQHNLYERTITIGYDNTPTIAWALKGPCSTSSAPVYLLCIQFLHQCFYCYIR